MQFDVIDFKNTDHPLKNVADISIPMCSLINHSCDPNAAKIYVSTEYGPKVVVIAQRPIPSNDQVSKNTFYKSVILNYYITLLM